MHAPSTLPSTYATNGFFVDLILLPSSSSSFFGGGGGISINEEHMRIPIYCMIDVYLAGYIVRKICKIMARSKPKAGRGMFIPQGPEGGDMGGRLRAREAVRCRPDPNFQASISLPEQKVHLGILLFLLLFPPSMPQGKLKGGWKTCRRRSKEVTFGGTGGGGKEGRLFCRPFCFVHHSSSCSVCAAYTRTLALRRFGIKVCVVPRWLD